MSATKRAPGASPLTEKQRLFVDTYTKTGDKGLAGRIVAPHVVNPHDTAAAILGQPGVAKAVQVARRKRLDLSDAADLAVTVLVDTMKGKAFSPALKVKAADIALRHYKAFQGDEAEKDLSAMDAGELKGRAAELRLQQEALEAALREATALYIEAEANDQDDLDPPVDGAVNPFE